MNNGIRSIASSVCSLNCLHTRMHQCFPKINKIPYKVKTMNINAKYKSRRHARIFKKFYQYEAASTYAVGARDPRKYIILKSMIERIVAERYLKRYVYIESPKS